MPKSLERAVSKMLADPDFYPGDKKRKSIAYAIAEKNKKKKKQFITLDSKTKTVLLQKPDAWPGVQVADVVFQHGKLKDCLIYYGQSLEIDAEIDLLGLGRIIHIEILES